MAPSILLPLALCVLASFPSSNAKMDPGAYAPQTNQKCPETLLRQSPASNQTIDPNESQYLADRRKLLPDAWRAWVGDGSNLGYDLNKLSITANNGSGLPLIGIALSGGGYRSAQASAGIISGLDARNATAKAKGTGGLVQVSSYLSGVSGGSWLISSMLFHDFPDVYDLVMGNTNKGGNLNGWLLDKDLALPNGLNPFDDSNEHYFGSVLWSVDDKGRTGLDTSLTDIWSCALAYHFLTGLGEPSTADTVTSLNNFFTNDTSHGTGILWSDMINIPTFQKREFPLPIVVAGTRPPGFAQLSPNPGIPLNSTQWEFTPWEFGSHDPNLSSFVDIRFMGTHLINGKPTNSSACVTKFDQASFIFGTSSSLFNVLLSTTRDQIKQFDPYASNALLELLRRMVAVVSTRADDVANYPNPFQGINPAVYQDSNSTWLELVDGALNTENLPLGPLLVKARHLDVIVAVDASDDDSDNWPQAVSLYATRNRTQQVTTSVVQRFPPIPDNQADIDRLGLNRRPTFFGCDPKESPAEFPLLIYIPNAPPVDGSDPVANPSSFKLQYQPWHTSQFLDQAQATAFSGFMEGQLGADPEFGSCLQCAAIDRARLKTNPITPRSDICSKCFKKYCFDPVNPPPEGQIVGRRFQFKDPDPLGLKSFFVRNKIPFIVGTAIAGLALIISIVCCVIYCRKRTQGKKARSAQYRRLATDGSEWSVNAGRHSYEMSKSHQ